MTEEEIQRVIRMARSAATMAPLVQGHAHRAQVAAQVSLWTLRSVPVPLQPLREAEAALETAIRVLEAIVETGEGEA